jgi:transposase
MASRVELSEDEHQQLQRYVRQGASKGRGRTRAQVLLKLAENWSVGQVCEAFDVSRATLYNTLARYRQGGITLVMQDRVQARRRQALTGEEEALLVAITCSSVPDGHDHWTLRMLRDKLVEIGVVDRISPSTIHALLKKTNSNPGSTSPGASPHSMRRF